MAKICIVHESREIDEAEYFIGELCQENDEVKLICNDRFPIAVFLVFKIRQELCHYFWQERFNSLYLDIKGNDDSTINW
jgi:hypothetical protein